MARELRDAVSKNVAVIVILTVFAAPLLAWNDSDTIPAAYHDSITAVANVTVGDERFTDSGEFLFYFRMGNLTDGVFCLQSRAASLTFSPGLNGNRCR
jgi:hypothetical protein